MSESEERYLRAISPQDLHLILLLDAMDAERAEVARLKAMIDRWQAATGDTLEAAEALRRMEITSMTILMESFKEE